MKLKVFDKLLLWYLSGKNLKETTRSTVMYFFIRLSLTHNFHGMLRIQLMQKVIYLEIFETTGCEIGWSDCKLKDHNISHLQHAACYSSEAGFFWFTLIMYYLTIILHYHKRDRDKQYRSRSVRSHQSFYDTQPLHFPNQS